MISKLFFSVGTSIYTVELSNAPYVLTEKDIKYEIRSIAVDPHDTGRMYAGSFNDGLLVSDDFGVTWHQAGKGIRHERILSIAVSESEVISDYGVVWVGTEPSGLFRSEDGGKTWTERTNLLNLPSASTWSFPPRPHTHHVRSIQPDIHDPNRIFVGIELGGVMKSDDKGLTWEDRKPNSQFDCHTLTMSKRAKNRIYEAAGGGYAESKDGGITWETINDGLFPYTYLVSVAVDSANPDTIIASAAKNARTAYMPERAHTVLVRKEKGTPWEVVDNGLPSPEHSSAFLLVSDSIEPHVFYAINNTGIYKSVDSGKSWHRLEIDWPKKLRTKRILSVSAY